MEFFIFQKYGLALLSYGDFFLKSCYDWACGSCIISNHKRYKSNNNTPDRPHRVPRLRVVVWYTEANPVFCLEPPRFCHHQDCWWLPWILAWKYDHAHVVPIFIRLVRQPKNNKIPLVDIVRVRRRYEIILSDQPLGVLRYLFFVVFSQSFILFCKAYCTLLFIHFKIIEKIYFDII